MRYVVATLFVCLLFQSPAEARRSHHHHGHHFKHHRLHHDGLWRHRSIAHRHYNRRIRTASAGDGGARYGRGGRPRAWCGWFARRMVGQDPGPAFNLARNWVRWGRPAAPAVGVMVVWSHHVGMITGRTADGRWIVKSGNDGHAVRERPRSLAGAIAFRQG